MATDPGLPPAAASPQTLAVIAGGVLLAGTFLLAMGGAGSWFQPGVRLQFRTLDASGLQPGMAVKISGFPVGRVRQIRLQPDAQVLVDLDVRDTYRGMVGRRSRAELAQDGLLGSHYIAITPDPAAYGQPPIRSGEAIVFRARPGLDDLLVELARTRIPLQKALRGGVNLAEQRLPRSLDELDRTLVAARGLAGSLRSDTGRSAAELNRTLVETRRLAARLEGKARGTASGVDGLLDRYGRAEQEAVPLLLTTLRELTTMADATNRLVRTLRDSWLFELIERSGPPSGRPPTGTKDPAAPPPTPSRAPLLQPPP